MINTQTSQIPAQKQQQFQRPWALWLLFFFYYAAIGAYFAYLNIYYRSAGLSGTEIGVLNMTSSIIGVASAVFWGNLADRTGKPRWLIAVGAVLGLTLAQFIPLMHSFWGFLALSAAGSLLGSAPGTLVDSTTMALLGERRNDYGRFRLGGSIGYIIMAPLAGIIFDQPQFGLKIMFPIYGIIMVIFAAIALLLPDLPVKVSSKENREIGAMMRQPVWLLLIACVFLAWIAYYASITFTGVLLSSMGANQTLIGRAVTIGAIVELPFMLFSPQILRRFGPVLLLAVAFGLSVLRYFLLSWMPSPEWAIPINALNGPAFVLFWNSAVNLANRLAPPGMAGTAQGLLSSTMSLSGVVSALLTGILTDKLTPNGVFLVMAFVTLAAFLLFVAGNLRSLRAESIARADSPGTGL